MLSLAWDPCAKGMPTENIRGTRLIRKNIAEVFRLESVYSLLVKYSLKHNLVYLSLRF